MQFREGVRPQRERRGETTTVEPKKSAMDHFILKGGREAVLRARDREGGH